MRRSGLSSLVKAFALLQLFTYASAQEVISTRTLVQPISRIEDGQISAPPTATPTSSEVPGPKVHTVVVGVGGFTIKPQELFNVSKGDTVTFEFGPPHHSVARAEYGAACVPYEYSTQNPGFFSGVMEFEDPQKRMYYNLTINSTEPIFYYCAAPNSCKGELMVGVINPNATQTLAQQIVAAKNADFGIAPGEKIPSEASSTLHAPGPTSPAASSPASHGGSGGSHGLSGGVIAGIVVGALAFLALCAALFFYVGRTKSLKESLNRNEATVKSSGTPGTDWGQPSPGFYPGSPYSPRQSQQVEYGLLPGYSQHHATDSHPSGWASPNQGHLSMASQPPMRMSMGENKPYGWSAPAAEMPSPGIAAELEAPNKPQH